jgi:hypothetical protein
MSSSDLAAGPAAFPTRVSSSIPLPSVFTTTVMVVSFAAGLLMSLLLTSVVQHAGDTEPPPSFEQLTFMP